MSSQLPPGFELEPDSTELPAGFELETPLPQGATRLGGSEAALSPAQDRGWLDAARDWLTGAASESRIADADRAAAREAGIGMTPTAGELAEAGLAGVAAGALPGAALVAPMTTGGALLGGLVGGKIGGELGELLGEQAGPGVGQTYGRPAGEFTGSLAGGVAGSRAIGPVGRVVERAGKAIYARGLPEPPASAAKVTSRGPESQPVRGSAPQTRLDVAEELLAPGKRVPVMARTVRQRALDALSETNKGLTEIADQFPVDAAARAQAVKNMAAMPLADAMKPAALRRALKPVTDALAREHPAEAATFIDAVQARVSALVAAGRTKNLSLGESNLFLGGAGAALHLGNLVPVAGQALMAVTAARQPIVSRAAGAGLVTAGRRMMAERAALSRGELPAAIGTRGTLVSRGARPAEVAARQGAITRGEAAPAMGSAQPAPKRGLGAMGRLGEYAEREAAAMEREAAELARASSGTPAASAASGGAEAASSDPIAFMAAVNEAASRFGMKSGAKVYYIDVAGSPIFLKSAAAAKGAIAQLAKEQGWKRIAPSTYETADGSIVKLGWARALGGK